MAFSSLNHAKSSGSSLFAVLSLNVLQSLDEQKIQSLKAIGINSIGDLLHYKPIHHSQVLMAVHRGEIGHDILLDKYLDTAFVNKKPSELADLPLVAIEGIGQSTESIFQKPFGVTSIRELSVFPPFIEAQNYLAPDQEVFNEPASAPEDLMPKILGNTSSIARYSSFVMDEEIRLEKGLGLQDIGRRPISNIELVELFRSLKFECYLGYIAGFKQSWINMGTHLGEVIHSLALAPGESRNIAIIEWYRRQSSSRTEETIVDEQLTNRMVHSRALDEVTRVTAKEHQSGQTDTVNNTLTTANSENKGFNIGGAVSAVADLTTVVGFPLTTAAEYAGNMNSGKSSVYSNSSQVGTIQSSSSGNRDVLGEMSQNITDSTLQNSSNIRSLWSTVVVSDEQSEKEDIQTRNVTNYNHSHALTVQYFEVLQKYNVRLELNDWTPVLFLPYKPLSFHLKLIQKYWHLLKIPLLKYFPEKYERYLPFIMNSLADMSSDDVGGNYVVEKVKITCEASNTPFYKYISVLSSGIGPGSSTGSGGYWNSSFTTVPGSSILMLEKADGSIINLHHPLSDASQEHILNISLKDLKDLVIKPNNPIFSKPLLNGDEHINYDITLHFYLKDEDGNNHTVVTSVNGSLKFADIYSTYTNDEVIPLNQNFQNLITSDGGLSQSDQVLIQELEDHFNQTRYGYTRFLISTLEKEQLIDIFENLYLDPNSEINAKRLTDYIYPASVGVSDNFLIFKFKKQPGNVQNDPFWDYVANLKKQLVAEQDKVVRNEDAYLPTSGVFAEAILGRANASEFVNPRRFWNWQDSPIPHLAPQIAQIQAGNHVVNDQSEVLNPNVPASNLNIINPPQYALPTSLNAALQAVQNGNMFRDMSKSGELVNILGKLADLANNTAQISGNLTGQAAENALKGAIELGNQVAGMMNNASNILDRGANSNTAPSPKSPTEKAAALNNLDTIKKNTNSDGSISPIDQASANAMGTPINSEDDKNETNIDSEGSDEESEAEFMTAEKYRSLPDPASDYYPPNYRDIDEPMLFSDLFSEDPV